MAPHAEPSDRLTATRGAIEHDVQELRARLYSARGKITASLSAIAELGTTMSAFVARRNGARGRSCDDRTVRS